jgi:hypothetical protein
MLGKYMEMSKADFQALLDKSTDGMLTRLASRLETEADNTSKVHKDEKTWKPMIGTNGLLNYLQRQDESDYERQSRERFWRSLGKKIRNGSRIRTN